MNSIPPPHSESPPGRKAMGAAALGGLAIVILAVVYVVRRDGGTRSESGPPTVPVVHSQRVEVFTPWHPADRELPFPEDGQWYWRDILSASPAPAPAADDSEAAHHLTGRLEELAPWTPLESEPDLPSLVEPAALAPRALDRALDDERRNVRYAAARLLLRVVSREEDYPSAELREYLAESAARHLRDEAEEVALLLLTALQRVPARWVDLRLAKTFGRYDNHPLVVARAVAATALARRGCHGGVPLLLKILKEGTSLQDNLHREWGESERTAWWKEEALKGIEALAGTTFGFSPDAVDPQQIASIRSMEQWWSENRRERWAQSPAFGDGPAADRVKLLILGLGTFQLRNVDNAGFLLTALGPPAAPLLLEALEGSSFQIRCHVLEVLRDLMPLAPAADRKRWVAALDRHLRETAAEPLVRQKSLAAIGASGLDSALDILQAQLDSGDPALGEVALEGLARFPSPKARQVLQDFTSTLPDEHVLRIPTLAALLAQGETGSLEIFLGTLAGAEPEASRATVYLSWFLEVDDWSTAGTPEERERALDRIRNDILGRSR